MIELLKKLCALDGVSGDEQQVRDFIISEIKDFCEYKTDALGNLICLKKCKKRAAQKLMIDAHMDEVGLIIASVTSEGYLKFKNIGAIDVSALMFKKVKINGKVNGVIGSKPVHLLSNDEAKKLPSEDSLYIDIGVSSKAEALEYVSLGDRAVLCSDITILGDNIKAKAIDDRIGCAVLIALLKEESEYDYYATFSVQEEIGARGAKTATYSVDPRFALVIEATTASDIAGVSEDKSVCNLGNGPVISFMDRGTLYDKALYNAAMNSDISCQTKRAVAGGNNSSAVHLSREGVRTLAISLPCRYIHTPSNMANISDCKDMLRITKYMRDGICGGKIK